MARRATRNRQFIGYTLGLWNALGDDHLILRRRGGLSNFVWTDNLFSAWARPGNFFSCGMGLGKIYFRVNMVSQFTVHCTEAINRNSNAIESSRILWWNYELR